MVYSLMIRGVPVDRSISTRRGPKIGTATAGALTAGPGPVAPAPALTDGPAPRLLLAGALPAGALLAGALPAVALLAVALPAGPGPPTAGGLTSGGKLGMGAPIAG